MKQLSARITRDRTSKAASLQIATEGKWQLFSGLSVESIQLSKPVLRGEGSGTFPIGVQAAVRSYFQLMTEEGQMMLAEERLPMSGGYNFRDLGGKRTRSGHIVKWGKLLRTDDLHTLTPEDLKYLESIPVTTVVDFRSEEEVKLAPDLLPSTVKATYPYYITPGNLSASPMDFAAMAGSDPATGMDMNQLMMQMNRLLVSEAACIRRFKDFFALLQEEENLPLLFHCSAGKDRTGMASALILSALGVDEETIIQDYLLSNTYLEDKYGMYTTLYPELKPLFEVKAEYLLAGLEQIKTNSGSIESYLRDVLAVDLEKIRKIYL